jgi:fatty-acyl-CoA synthase
MRQIKLTPTEGQADTYNAFGPVALLLSRSEATVGSALRAQSIAAPGAAAVIGMGKDGKRQDVWTYQRLYSDSLRCAGFLAARFPKGTRVVLAAQNCPEWIIFQFGAALAGLVLVTTNPEATNQEFSDLLKQTGAATLFHDQLAPPEISATVAVLPFQDALAPHMPVPGEDDLPKVLQSDPAIIVFTSGTTGAPKGVIHSHHALLSMGLAAGERYQMNRLSIWASFSPLFNIGGCVSTLMTVLASGCAVCQFEDSDAVALLDAIETEKITFFWSVPTFLMSLLQAQNERPRDINSLQACVAGGADFAPTLIEQAVLQLNCTFHSTYALTECLEVTMTYVTDSIEDIAHTSGPPYDGLQLSVRGPDGDAELPEDMIGEIHVHGNTKPLGYCGPTPAQDQLFEEGTWFATGDLGKLDARGYLTVTGRIKDVINRGGQIIAPIEIETALLRHEAIRSAAALGLPSVLLGESVAAFVQIQPGMSITREELDAHCKGILAPFKVPASYYIVDDFELTGSSKIRKSVLRDQVETNTVRRLKYCNTGT